MPRPKHPPSRRERQILDVLFRFGEADVATVLEALPDPPSYSAVRATLTLMEKKGHVTHRAEGARYVYLPRGSRKQAQKAALRRVVDTFFGGDAEETFAALLDLRGKDLDEDELARLERLVQRAADEGR